MRGLALSRLPGPASTACKVLGWRLAQRKCYVNALCKHLYCHFLTVFFGVFFNIGSLKKFEYVSSHSFPVIIYAKCWL